MELRSRVDSRHLPEQLRVRIQCRWRVTPSLSCCLWSAHTILRAGTGICLFSCTPRKGSRSSIRHHLERTKVVLSRNSDLFCTNSSARKKKNNLRVFGPNSPPRFVFSGVLGFRTFVSNMCLFVPFLFFVVFVFLSARVSELACEFVLL